MEMILNEIKFSREGNNTSHMIISLETIELATKYNHILKPLLGKLSTYT